MYTEELARRIKGKPQEGEEEPVEQVLQLGTMLDSLRCDIGTMILDPDDYKINKRLKERLTAGDKVLVVQLTEEQHILMMKVVEP